MPESTLTGVKIEKLVYGGDGLARLAENPAYPDKTGAVVFVPFSAPGDVLGLLPDFSKKPYHAKITGVESPSENRVEAPCSVFGACGGCDWQHINGSAQREWKSRIVEETLARLGKLKDINVPPPIQAQDWRYRNKAQWQFLPSGELAYLAEESHQGVAFDECLIIQPALQKVAESLRKPENSRLLLDANISKITVRANRENELLLVLHTAQTEPDYPNSQSLVASILSDDILLKGMMLEFSGNWHCLYGDDFLKETLQKKTFHVSVQSFFQVSPQAAELMLETLLQWFSDTGLNRHHLLDLYGGVGTFAIGLGDGFEKITMVESSAIAVSDAQKNFQHAGFTSKTEVIEGRVEAVLASTQQDEKSETQSLSPTVTLLDPPRKGCHPKVLSWAAENTKDAIVYVSCDPTTLARDLAKLDELGWKTDKIQPVDMFPQTYHIETLVLLTPAK